jgi:hypothetical protein
MVIDIHKSLGHLVTWPLGHLVTWSLGHLVTWSLGHFHPSQIFAGNSGAYWSGVTYWSGLASSLDHNYETRV